MENRIYCACGCGKLVPVLKQRRGGICKNRRHAAVYRNKQRKLLAHKSNNRKKQDKFAGYCGQKSCLNYDDNDIQCVMCFENEWYVKKPCRVKPKRRKRNTNVEC